VTPPAWLYLKVQVAALRKALGADRDFIHIEFGGGYRFTGVVRSKSRGGKFRCFSAASSPAFPLQDFPARRRGKLLSA
jgi:hypothetical protein